MGRDPGAGIGFPDLGDLSIYLGARRLSEFRGVAAHPQRKMGPLTGGILSLGDGGGGKEGLPQLAVGI